jgi:hypothetical protein
MNRFADTDTPYDLPQNLSNLERKVAFGLYNGPTLSGIKLSGQLAVLLIRSPSVTPTITYDRLQREQSLKHGGVQLNQSLQ